MAIQDDIMAYHTGSYGAANAVISEGPYMNGAAYAATDSGNATGKIGLSMVSVAILGLMFFYIATRGRQY